MGSKLIELKSDIISEQHKAEGNKFYMERNFDKALECYNKALCFAQSPKKLAILYANRSALYLELKHIKECLMNIQWAKENNYPAEKIEKLNAREAKCKQLMETDAIEEIPDFFKLSHPPNPKIPFIIDCLEIQSSDKSLPDNVSSNERFGRGIFTTRDLQPGDIIAIEPEPAFFKMTPQVQYSWCCNCIKSNLYNLLPCLKTASLMFCSIECRNRTYAKVRDENLFCLIDHENAYCTLARYLFDADLAFGGRNNLLKFIETADLQNWNKTIFDYDFNDSSKFHENMMKSVLCFSINEIDPKYAQIFDQVATRLAKGNSLLKRFIELIGRLVHAHGTNLLTPDNTNVAPNSCQRLGVFRNLMKHSCFPNTGLTMYRSSLVYYANQPIKAGEQLTRNFFCADIFEKTASERRSYLESLFICKCFYCEENLDLKNLPHAKPNTSAGGFSVLSLSSISSGDSYMRLMSFLKISQDSLKGYKKQGVTQEFCKSSKALNIYMDFIAIKMSALDNSSI